MALKIGMWIARIVVTVLLACLLSIWTTSYVVTSYVQALLEEYEIPLEVKPVALANVWGMIWGADGKSKQEQLGEESNKPSTDLAQSLDEEEHSDLVADWGDSPDEGEPPQDQTVDEDGDGEKSPSNHSEDINLQSEQYNEPSEEVFAPIESSAEPTITPDEISASKDSLEQEEKERMFELIMGKLPPDSWQVFSSAMEDGLTEEELLEIQQLMALHLSKEEYNELMDLLKKE